MAKTVQCDRSLYKEYDKARKKCKILLICTGVSFVLFAVMGYINVETYGKFFFVMPILVVCFLASGIMAGRFSQQAQIIAVGLEGEKKTAELLGVLPDSYYCFQNLKIRHGDGVSEIAAATADEKDPITGGEADGFIIRISLCSRLGTVGEEEGDPLRLHFRHDGCGKFVHHRNITLFPSWIMRPSRSSQRLRRQIASMLGCSNATVSWGS